MTAVSDFILWHRIRHARKMVNNNSLCIQVTFKGGRFACGALAMRPHQVYLHAMS